MNRFNLCGCVDLGYQLRKCIFKSKIFTCAALIGHTHSFHVFRLRGQATVASELASRARAAHVSALGCVPFAKCPLKSLLLSFPSPPSLSPSLSPSPESRRSGKRFRRLGGSGGNQTRLEQGSSMAGASSPLKKEGGGEEGGRGAPTKPQRPATRRWTAAGVREPLAMAYLYTVLLLLDYIHLYFFLSQYWLSFFSYLIHLSIKVYQQGNIRVHSIMHARTHARPAWNKLARSPTAPSACISFHPFSSIVFVRSQSRFICAPV